ncbi:MAG TPA: ROK family protein [Planctomycetota bacterium]|nr:ROK family protein [Planctomycetota bacterium]
MTPAPPRDGGRPGAGMRRRPVGVRASRAAALVSVGCDVGGTAIKLVRLRGRRIEEAFEVPTPARAPTMEAVRSIAEAIQRSASVPGAARAHGEPLPVGIALPGFLDPERRRVIYLSNVPSLNGVCLAREVERLLAPRLKARVVLDADTNAGAVAEARLGAGRGFERVLYITLGTGLGAALAAAGRPVRVSRHTVGQIAHLPIAKAGPPCACGQRGCAETLLSARGVLWLAAGRGVSGVKDTKTLFLLARGEMGGARSLQRKAAAVWRDVGYLLGDLVRILAPLFSPGAIVLGGGVAAAASLFLPAAKARLSRRLPRRPEGGTVLLEAERGRFAGALGAALLALDPAPVPSSYQLPVHERAPRARARARRK